MTDAKAIAENLMSKRVIAKNKYRTIGESGLIHAIRYILDNPDPENRTNLSPGDVPLLCTLCEQQKAHLYFSDAQRSQAGDCRVCRYCTWRIKTKVDDFYRAEMGLEQRQSSTDTNEELSPIDHTAEIRAFIAGENTKSKSHNRMPTQVQSETTRLSGYCGPEFANLSSGWYFKTRDPNYATERDEMLQWWNSDCDAVLHWYVLNHGMFVSAFEEDIARQLVGLSAVKRKIARYAGYFYVSRILELPTLMEIYIADLSKRCEQCISCLICSNQQKLIHMHPDRVRWTDGKILPLCESCFGYFKWSIGSSTIAGKLPSDFVPLIVELLGKHDCPVCMQSHSWCGKFYEYKNTRRPAPTRFTEICFNCASTTFLKSRKRVSSSRSLAVLRKIAALIGNPPCESMYEVVYRQSANVKIAAEVVKLMKEARNFSVIKDDCKKSWFAALARAGCFPDGTRKEFFGTRILAKDGHVCLSIAEKEIDDLLTLHGIPHEKEVKYPNSDFVSDWVLVGTKQPVFVEYFGLIGREEYDDKIRAKRELADLAGITLIEFLPEDLRDLDSAFRRKLLEIIEPMKPKKICRNSDDRKKRNQR